MGIDIVTAGLIVRESGYRPITGEFLTIGRQTMWFDAETALRVLSCNGLNVENLSTADFDFEQRTIQTGPGSQLVTAESFMRHLGVHAIKAIDVSDYEGAEIVHDLTIPIPSELENISDFIVDGSTLDNVWDPALALKNLARMTRPGGRIVSVNMASNTYGPYTILSAPRVFDFFAENEWRDIRVYIQVSKPEGPFNIFRLDPSVIGMESMEHVRNLPSTYTMGLFFVAEKRQNSTWDLTQTQQFYLSGKRREDFIMKARKMLSSDRPDLLHSTADQFIEAPLGYLYVRG